MRLFFIFFGFLLLVSCAGKDLQKTDQKKIFTSNTNLFFDNDKKLFKYQFSINNYSKNTLNNFVYSIVFKNSKGVAINTFDRYYEGSIEPNKAGRAHIYIGDYIRKNFKEAEIYIKK